MSELKRWQRMNFLSRLFSRQRRPQFDDAVFGRLEFDSGVWTHIPKDKKDVLIVLFASESGPVESQREFFRTLSRSLEVTVESARRFIQDSARDIDAASLALYAIEIGAPEEIARGLFVIELSDADQNQIHRAEFVGGKPTVYGCDT